MDTECRFQKDVLEIYKIVSIAYELSNQVATEAGWMIGRTGASIAKKIAQKPIEEILIAVTKTGSSVSTTSAWEATSFIALTASMKTFSHRAMQTVREATSKVSDIEKIALEATRASLRCAIAQEEEIGTWISTQVKSAAIKSVANHTDVINLLLNFDGSFSNANLGCKCWYFARIWKLITFNMIDHTHRDKLIKRVSKEEPIIIEFMEWVMGPKYSLVDLLETCKTHCLIAPLLSIVYQLLAPPSWSLIRQEALSLI